MILLKNSRLSFFGRFVILQNILWNFCNIWLIFLNKYCEILQKYSPILLKIFNDEITECFKIFFVIDLE